MSCSHAKRSMVGARITSISWQSETLSFLPLSMLERPLNRFFRQYYPDRTLVNFSVFHTIYLICPRVPLSTDPLIMRASEFPNVWLGRQREKMSKIVGLYKYLHIQQASEDKMLFFFIITRDYSGNIQSKFFDQSKFAEKNSNK